MNLISNSGEPIYHPQFAGGIQHIDVSHSDGYEMQDYLEESVVCWYHLCQDTITRSLYLGI